MSDITSVTLLEAEYGILALEVAGNGGVVTPEQDARMQAIRDELARRQQAADAIHLNTMPPGLDAADVQCDACDTWLPLDSDGEPYPCPTCAMIARTDAA